MSAKGRTAIEGSFKDGVLPPLRVDRRYPPNPTTATIASPATAATQTLRLAKGLSSFERTVLGRTFSPATFSSAACDADKTGGSFPLSFATEATNRYPRFGTVSMNSG